MSGRASIAGGMRRDSVGSSYSYRNSIVGGMRRDSVQYGHRDSIAQRRDSVSSSGSIVMRVLQARDSMYSRSLNERSGSISGKFARSRISSVTSKSSA
jgi:hypothetical protein